MNHGPVAVEQTGLGQKVTAGAQRAHDAASLGPVAQRGLQFGIELFGNTDAAAHEQHVGFGHSTDPLHRFQVMPATGPNWLAVLAHHRPFVHGLTTGPIGHAQSFDGTGQGQERVVRNNQEGNANLEVGHQRLNKAVFQRDGFACHGGLRQCWLGYRFNCDKKCRVRVSRADSTPKRTGFLFPGSGFHNWLISQL